MRGVHIDIPPDVADGLRLPPPEAEVRLKRELAARLYEKRILSLSLARRLAGMTRWQFHEWLTEQGIARDYGVDELEADAAAIRDLP